MNQSKYYGDGCYYITCKECFHEDHCSFLKQYPETQGCLFRCGATGVWTHFPMNEVRITNETK